MFKFLKDKLKKAVSKFSKDVEEQGEDVEVEVKKKFERHEEEKAPAKRPEKEEKAKKPRADKVQADKDEKEMTPEPKEEAEETKEKEVKAPTPVSEEKKTSKVEPTPAEEPKPVEEDKVQTEKEESDEGPPEEKPAKREAEEPKKGFFSRFRKAKEQKEPEKESPAVAEQALKEVQEPVQDDAQEQEAPAPTADKEEIPKAPEPEPASRETTPAIPSEPEPSKKGMFGFITEKITKKSISEEKFEQLFFELELALLENNVAVEVIDKIKKDLQGKIVGTPLPRGKIEEKIIGSLIDSIRSLFSQDGFDLLSKIEEKKPYVICFLGINGSGKTTSIAKVAHRLLEQEKSVVLAAADTFRAAAIDQLQLHADKLGVRLIKHDYGADAAAVAFDAVKHAEAKGADVVLIDTAGRMHSNVNLQDELKKIVRVAKPDLKVFVGEAITGNDCIEQAVKFDEIVGIDAIILTKADVDEKGGAFVSVSYVTKKPIIFIGMGQEYGDLKPFSKDIVMENLGLA